jgi:hypothetical protein
MRESRTYGSVRGALSDERPYRDLVVPNLLAFGFHTAAMLGVLAWRQAVIARGAIYRFFERLRTITAYVVFHDWDHAADTPALTRQSDRSRSHLITHTENARQNTHPRTISNCWCLGKRGYRLVGAVGLEPTAR